MVELNCKVCGRSEIEEIKSFGALARVTSDCRPFRKGGRVACCAACGAIQKIADSVWLAEISEIYKAYEPYYQAGGEEQVVLDPKSGEIRKRSEVLVDWVFRTSAAGGTGKVLDIGCGNGATLKSFSMRSPGWELYGHELNSGAESALLRIPGFRRLFSGDLSEVNEQFDLVFMVHSLEHFVDPPVAVNNVADLLSPDGWLFIEVCNVLENPFDLLIADHLMHFSPNSLEALLARSGLEVVHASTNCVKKEISILARRSRGSRLREEEMSPSSIEKSDECMHLKSSIEWMNKFCAAAIQQGARQGARKIGIFGTSVAGTWLASHLQGVTSFFVDEDVNRIGKTHMGLPILAPNQVSPEAAVILALAPGLGALIKSRLVKYGFEVIEPSATS